MEAEGSFDMCSIHFSTKGFCIFASYTERYGVCAQTKCKSYLASKVLYLESHLVAGRGSAQHFGPTGSLVKKRWLGKDDTCHDIQPVTLALSGEAIWHGDWADIWKSDAEPEAPRTLLLPPLVLDPDKKQSRQLNLGNPHIHLLI